MFFHVEQWGDFARRASRKFALSSSADDAQFRCCHSQRVDELKLLRGVRVPYIRPQERNDFRGGRLRVRRYARGTGANVSIIQSSRVHGSAGVQRVFVTLFLRCSARARMFSSRNLLNSRRRLELATSPARAGIGLLAFRRNVRPGIFFDRAQLSPIRRR